MEFLELQFLENTLKQWIFAFLASGASYLVFRLFIHRIAHHLSHLAKRTKVDWDDFIIDLLRNRTKSWILIIFSVYIGSRFLTLPGGGKIAVKAAATAAFFYQVALWGSGFIEYAIKKAGERAEGDPGSASTYSALSFIAKVLLWAIILLLILHNIGVDVTALVASLGIGGIAIALAVQNILGDLFASMTIVLDKPFILGDFIIVGELMGTVEHIGLKTTRIRSLSGEQIVFTNNDLLGSRIRNFKRMWERRVVFSLGVTYETPPDKLEAIPSMIKEIIDTQEQARFDRAHFSKYGDSALIYEMVYFVRDPDYNVYMDTQQDINLKIFRKFSEEGIEFAYPTQTLYISRSEAVEGGKEKDG